jgi:hypothetical protein
VEGWVEQRRLPATLRWVLLLLPECCLGTLHREDMLLLLLLLLVVVARQLGVQVQLGLVMMVLLLLLLRVAWEK